jgi:hopanoid biosynthesis associated protein HpnK
LRRIIVCADDFGLDVAVNDAVEAAHREGVLTCTSLMVASPAAEDAVRRARLMPSLRVGLHVVLVDGKPALPPEMVPDLVDEHGLFDDRMVRAGVRFFFLPRVRRQLAAEIRAQFEAFKATGLPLDHANAHKHMHLHPTIAGMIVAIGRDYGLKAVRVPAEPFEPLRRAGERRSPAAALAQAGLDIWIRLLRYRLRRAGLSVNDHLFGLAWTGGMTEERFLRLLPSVPDGVSEIYFHPASSRSSALTRAMPDYRHVDELAALMSRTVKERIAAAGMELISYDDLGVARS